MTRDQNSIVLALVVEFGTSNATADVEAWPNLLTGLAQLINADGYEVRLTKSAGLRDSVQAAQWGARLSVSRRIRLDARIRSGRPGTNLIVRTVFAGGPALAVFETERVVTFFRHSAAQNFGPPWASIVSAVIGACSAVSRRTSQPELPEWMQQVPTRLRQTLAGLLEGQSEKEIATHLQISRHTVHKYVTLLYRRAKVVSRPQLLSVCFRSEWERSIEGTVSIDMMRREYRQLPKRHVEPGDQVITPADPVTPVDGPKIDMPLRDLKPGEQFMGAGQSTSQIGVRHRPFRHPRRISGWDR